MDDFSTITPLTLVNADQLETQSSPVVSVVESEPCVDVWSYWADLGGPIACDSTGGSSMMKELKVVVSGQEACRDKGSCSREDRCCSSTMVPQQ